MNPSEPHAEEHSPAEAAWEDADQEPGPEDEVLDEAWAALDEGDAKGALAKLAQLDEDWPERWIPEALARLQLGELRRARVVLTQAEEFEDLGDQQEYLWAKAQLLLGEWSFGEARELLGKLLVIERTAPVLERLSLVSEMEGDFETAEGLLDEAASIDPEFVHAPRLSSEEFEREVDAAVKALPREFQKALETCEVLIDAMPSGWMLEPGDPSSTPPELLGLFVGAPNTEASADENAELPPRIFLFQRNLERAARDQAELREQIRVTLYHEIGHLLGFDEDGVAEMGLE
ncbi:MAG: metallopeptidase family protein [Planctomycetes bacterium]|nr:metallopeptidase family protein [Planctomycetota bacterium]